VVPAHNFALSWGGNLPVDAALYYVTRTRGPVVRMWRLHSALGHSDRLRALPALARDLCASALVLTAFAAAVAALPLVTVPAAALVLMPLLLFAAVVFGRDSAVLAALLAALMARLWPFGPTEGSVGLPWIAALCGAALLTAALLEELRRSRAEAETAHLRSDTTARRASERVEAARRQLRDAEARLADAERKTARQAVAVTRASSPDPALDSAFRSEGGI
jgi:hypothetical protein